MQNKVQWVKGIKIHHKTLIKRTFCVSMSVKNVKFLLLNNFNAEKKREKPSPVIMVI